MPWGDGHQPRLGKTGWQRQRDNRRVIERDRHRCYVLGCTTRATIVDHIVPLSRGGLDVDTNKAAICKPHHDAKTAAEAAHGRALRSRHRPIEPHPGIVRRGGG